MSEQKSVEIKAEFIGRMRGSLEMQMLFNALPDIYFFVKDRAGRFVMGNDLFVRQCGVGLEAEIIGKTDHDFFVVERAERYIRDDVYVMDTGESIFNRIELGPEPGNLIHWVITTKVPVYGEDGLVIGVAGTARDINRAGDSLRPYIEMQLVFEYIRDHYSGEILVRELADLVDLSVSQFERRFRKQFQITPLKHIMNVRIRAARLQLVRTHQTIASIAQDCGFYDHAHFTRNFHQLMGMTPSAYRVAYGQ